MNEGLKLSLYKPKQSSVKVVIKTSTYLEKECLYNYHLREKKHFIKEKTKIDPIEKIYFYKENNNVTISSTQSPSSQNLLFAMKMKEQIDGIIFQIIEKDKVQKKVLKDFSADEKDVQNSKKPYYVVSSFKSVSVTQNMIIRFGETNFFIYKLKLDTNPPEVPEKSIRNNKNLPEQNQKKLKFKQDEEPDPSNHCRVCYDEQNQKRYLVSLCSCSGTLKWIHLDCLFQWINKVIKKRQQRMFGEPEGNNRFCCEICKQPYPQFLQLKDKTFKLLEKKQPSSISFTNRFYIDTCYLNSPEMVAGRRKENWCKIMFDKTVSHQHAVFKIDQYEQKLQVEDLGSEYGTLAWQQNMKFKILKKKKNMMRIIQCQNTIFMFQLQIKHL